MIAPSDRTQKLLLSTLPIIVAVFQYFGFTEPKAKNFDGAKEAQYSCCSMMHEEMNDKVKLETDKRKLQEELLICKNTQ